ncbi:MAG: prepilin peptidase [bacterium]|nr:prepilin peptidase [bacterium]
MLILLGCYSVIATYFSVFQASLLSKNIKSEIELTEKVLLFIVGVGVSLFWLSLRINELNDSYFRVFIEINLIQIALIDSYSKIIPNKILLIIIIAGIIGYALQQFTLNWIKVGSLSFITLSAQLLSIQLFKKRLFGWGDIKLLLLIIALYNERVLAILILSLPCAGLFGSGLILLKKGNLKTQIPVSPFFVSVTLIFSIIGLEDKNLILYLF